MTLYYADRQAMNNFQNMSVCHRQKTYACKWQHSHAEFFKYVHFEELSYPQSVDFEATFDDAVHFEEPLDPKVALLDDELPILIGGQWKMTDKRSTSATHIMQIRPFWSEF